MSPTGAAGHLETLDRLHSAVNSGDLEVISKALDEFLVPELQFKTPVASGMTGVEAQKRVWETLLRAFPDIHVHVEETITEGDKVASRNTVTGTHLGEYMGVPPTGRTVTYSEIFIVRFAEDGRIAEIGGVVDMLSQLRQIGAFPS